MSARPQNIGIKAIEIYFPSQVSLPAIDCLLGSPLYIFLGGMEGQRWRGLKMSHPMLLRRKCSRICQKIVANGSILLSSMLSKPISRSSMVLHLESTQSVLARPRWPSAMTVKVKTPDPVVLRDIIFSEENNDLTRNCRYLLLCLDCYFPSS